MAIEPKLICAAKHSISSPTSRSTRIYEEWQEMLGGGHRQPRRFPEPVSVNDRLRGAGDNQVVDLRVTGDGTVVGDVIPHDRAEVRTQGDRGDWFSAKTAIRLCRYPAIRECPLSSNSSERSVPKADM
jgi:hypothetical protein